MNIMPPQTLLLINKVKDLLQLNCHLKPCYLMRQCHKYGQIKTNYTVNEAHCLRVSFTPPQQYLREAI